MRKQGVRFQPDTGVNGMSNWNTIDVVVKRFTLVLFTLLTNNPSGSTAEPNSIPPETPAASMRRHERVAARRAGIDIICHRGASEHAFENTLEAYRATFELGADGNEIDIRQTKDGVLVLFHDDMLDRNLEAYGDVSDFTWDELRQFRFRNPGRFGDQCRIPTLVEVFNLHRQFAGLIHLDIKRSGLDRQIADLLTQMDMWDHVAYCNDENGGVILTDPRLKLRRYKGGLYADRSEVFPNPIADILKMPGDGVIVDDPRGTIVALGRKLGHLSRTPVAAQLPRKLPDLPPPDAGTLIATLQDNRDWDTVAVTPEDQTASGQRIRARALAAEQSLLIPSQSTAMPNVITALEDRVRRRSLHKDWMYHGFDGAMALHSLILLKAPGAAGLARETLWRDDPALEPVIDTRWKNPRSWTDFRIKMVIFPALQQLPGAASEQLCRDYLALSDDVARQLSPPLFEEASRALLSISPTRPTAIELMRHRLQVVRGRAILDCLSRASEAWAIDALKEGAPHALQYRVDD